MSTYTVRVELHSSQYNPDFVLLHNAMQKEGFSKLITSGKGEIFHLPRGEYNISSTKDISQILGSAQRAVKETGESAEIFVTESLRRTWSGLAEKK